MTMTNEWLPPKEQYNTDNMLIRPGVFFDAGDKPSIHPNFFNATINDSCGCPYIYNDPISDTQILNHILLRSSMRIKRGDIDNSVENYDALWCKLQQIGVYVQLSRLLSN